jgi:hypothetical protein
MTHRFPAAVLNTRPPFRALFLGSAAVVALLFAARAGAESPSTAAPAEAAAAVTAPEPLAPAAEAAPEPAICGGDESLSFLTPASCRKPCNLITCPPPFWCDGPCWPEHCMA